MRTRHRFACTYLTVALTAGACCWGNEHRMVTAEEFLDTAGQPIGSVHSTQFIGATESRAYLGVWSGLPSSVGGGHHVYSVALEELPPALAERIRNGENPWPR